MPSSCLCILLCFGVCCEAGQGIWHCTLCSVLHGSSSAGLSTAHFMLLAAAMQDHLVKVTVLMHAHSSDLFMLHREGLVFGGQGITWMKVRLQIREAVDKVSEGVQFFTRGIRLLGSDCNNCGRLFYRAALGMHTHSRASSVHLFQVS